MECGDMKIDGTKAHSQTDVAFENNDGYFILVCNDFRTIIRIILVAMKSEVVRT